ncbi:MAG TPA: hypothetical protein PKE68_03950 [Saprospiraceae bacterium]|nr:hypothetical protein [Saprospiraceae bacterium]
MQFQLECPNCGARIHSDDINLSMLVAKCRQCHTVFGYDAMLLQKHTRQRPQVSMPKGIEAFSYLSELDIDINWYKTSNSGFIIFFTVFWNAVLLPFIIVALTTDEWIIMLFISIHLIIGLSFLYYTIALLFNITSVIASRHHIRIVHKPIKMPFYPDREVPVDTVEQVFVDQYVESTTNNRPNYAYAVRILTKDGQRLRLVKGLQTPEQAIFIEQEIERFLKIEDRPVAGEVIG